MSGVLLSFVLRRNGKRDGTNEQRADFCQRRVDQAARGAHAVIPQVNGCSAAKTEPLPHAERTMSSINRRCTFFAAFFLSAVQNLAAGTIDLLSHQQRSNTPALLQLLILGRPYCYPTAHDRWIG